MENEKITVEEESLSNNQCRESDADRFFFTTSVVYELVPRDTTINSEYYCGVLAKLREHVARRWPEIKKSWLIHHDKASPHTSYFTQAFLQK